MPEGGTPRTPARQAGGIGAWLGRIGVRAGLISLLMLMVVGLLAGSAIVISERKVRIVEQLGLRDREADAAVDEMALYVAEISSMFARVIAGMLPPGSAANGVVETGERLIDGFARVEQIMGASMDPILLGGGRDMARRLPELTAQVRDVFVARQRTQFAPLHEEWLDYATTFNRIIAAARADVKRRSDASLAEAHALQVQARSIALGAGAAGLVGCALVWVVLVRLIARPISRLAGSMERLSRGAVEAEVPGADRTDQVGDMARAVLVFRENLIATRKLTDTALENARRTAIATTQASEAIGQVSDGAMTQLAELRQVADALDQTEDAVREVGRTTQDSSDRADEAKNCLPPAWCSCAA